MTEQEELLKLRRLVKEQEQQLASKDELIEKQKIRIEKQNIQIENMIQALLHARKKLFGRSSECSAQIDGQMNLFETAQELAKELWGEQKKIAVPGYTRTARQPGIREEMLAGIPKEIEEYIINPEETCTQCGSGLKVIGKKVIRTEVEFIPAKLKVV